MKYGYWIPWKNGKHRQCSACGHVEDKETEEIHAQDGSVAKIYRIRNICPKCNAIMDKQFKPLFERW